MCGVAPGTQVGAQVVQFHHQLVRRAEIGPVLLHHAAVAVKPEVGVAITLVSTPGVDIGATRPNVFACLAHRFAKGQPGEHALVKRGGKHLARAVVHRPARRNHRAHTHADEFLAQVGGQPQAVQRACAVHAAQMAAVDKHQLRHKTQLGQVSRRQKGVAPNHHARDGFATRRLVPLVQMHAVPGQVHDAPAVFVQRLHDGGAGLVNTVQHFVAAVGQLLSHLARFFACTGQVGKVGRACQIGVANHQRGGVHAVHRALAEFGGAELAYKTRRHGRRSLAGGPAVFQQLPRVGGGFGVHHHHHIALLGAELAQAQRQQHLKQGFGGFGVLSGALTGHLHKALRQRQLPGGQRFFGAGPVGRENKTQVARFFDDFQPLVPLLRLVKAHPPPPALPGFHRPGIPAHFVGQRVGQHDAPQRFGGGNGDVLVNLQKLDAVYQHPAVQTLGGQAPVGTHRRAQHGLQRVAQLHAATAGANQQAGHRCRAGPPGFAKAGVGPVCGLQRKTQQRGTHRLFQQTGAQGPHLPQAHHHRTGGLATGGIIQKHRATAQRAGVNAQVQPPGQGTTELAVQHGFGADHRVTFVMTHHDRMARVSQIAMADADLDRR